MAVLLWRFRRRHLSAGRQPIDQRQEYTGGEFNLFPETKVGRVGL
jgi:hypothetical protein